MLDFNDTKTAFARKSDGEMRNALMLFRFEDRDKAPKILKDNKITIVPKDSIIKL